MNKTSAFKSFINSLGELKQASLTQVTVCTGSHQYLFNLVKQAIKKHWRDQVELVEPEYLLNNRFSDQFLQSSMFDPACLYICYAPNCNSQLIATLNQLTSAQSANKLVLFLSAKPTSGLTKLIKSSAAIKQISCTEPAPYEYSDFVSFEARRIGMKLDPGATKLVADCLGRDLNLIANELRRLDLIFVEEKRVLTRADIAPHLGLLKEEMIFRLRNHILERKPAHAEALLTDLMNRGESSLAILGFLAKHCRSSLIVGDSIKSGENAQEIARKSSLQKYLVSGYTKYVRNIGTNNLKQSLRLCVNADRKFKSAGSNHQIVLSEIIQNLC